MCLRDAQRERERERAGTAANEPEMWERKRKKKEKKCSFCPNETNGNPAFNWLILVSFFFSRSLFLSVAGDASGLSQFIRRAARANRNFCPINNSNLLGSGGGTKQSRRRTVGARSLDRWTSGRTKETGQSADAAVAASPWWSAAPLLFKSFFFSSFVKGNPARPSQ